MLVFHMCDDFSGCLFWKSKLLFYNLQLGDTCVALHGFKSTRRTNPLPSHLPCLSSAVSLRFQWMFICWHGYWLNSSRRDSRKEMVCPDFYSIVLCVLFVTGFISVPVGFKTAPLRSHQKTVVNRDNCVFNARINWRNVLSRLCTSVQWTNSLSVYQCCVCSEKELVIMFFSERTRTSRQRRYKNKTHCCRILLLQKQTYVCLFYCLGFISYYNELNIKLEIFHKTCNSFAWCNKMGYPPQTVGQYSLVVLFFLKQKHCTHLDDLCSNQQPVSVKLEFI